MNYKVMTDTLKDSSMLGSLHYVMGACLKISFLSKLSWKSVNITVIPRLTSDPANEFSANKDFFAVFRTRLTNMDSVNECFSGCVR
jgi:hypothetical protein